MIRCYCYLYLFFFFTRIFVIFIMRLECAISVREVAYRNGEKPQI